MEKYIIILIVAFILYYFYTCLNSKVEGFADDQSLTGVDEANSINTLAKVAQKLQEGGLTVPGNLNITSDLNVTGKFNYLPRGMVMAWFGAPDKVPTGWLLCDGNNGTPDLRNRFVVGVGSEYSLGAAGGNNMITLNINQMPSHAHKLSTNNFGSAADDIVAHSRSFGGADGEDRAIRRRHTSNELGLVKISNEGGGQPFDNRPPFLALVWIMKA